MKPIPKRIFTGTVILVVALVVSMTVQVEVTPPDHTRMILDRTNRFYIAPPCFNQAVITNNLSESTMKKAKELDYIPESTCTEQSLQAVHKPLLLAWMERFGLQKSNWNW
ncbi:hypothetical protein SAMN03159341_107125 [Paenibacillus sp. 1_12]|uniref:hypothetical protein n=1 Tax=Paenibacillus sp. 1_12 TaxID=1566278 RepID=UPI0008E6A7E0|nr:hypothetical protein [Paenibacillus sp. 1_12]SFL55812.1 hypothetical protein SAMN03159341_107125 [Paenibacillus sp. 1_12]